MNFADIYWFRIIKILPTMLRCPNDTYLSKHSVLNFLVAINLTHQVNYGGFSAKYEEMIAYRHYSENGRYIYISASTKKPEVKLV